MWITLWSLPVLSKTNPFSDCPVPLQLVPSLLSLPLLLFVMCTPHGHTTHTSPGRAPHSFHWSLGSICIFGIRSQVWVCSVEFYKPHMMTNYLQQQKICLTQKFCVILAWSLRWLAGIFDRQWVVELTMNVAVAGPILCSGLLRWGGGKSLSCSFVFYNVLVWGLALVRKTLSVSRLTIWKSCLWSSCITFSHSIARLSNCPTQFIRCSQSMCSNYY